MHDGSRLKKAAARMRHGNTSIEALTQMRQAPARAEQHPASSGAMLLTCFKSYLQIVSIHMASTKLCREHIVAGSGYVVAARAAAQHLDLAQET